MRKRSSSKKRFKLRSIIIPFCIILLVGSGLFYGWWIVHHAPYFRVEEIIVRGGVSPDLLHIKGRNIFDVDFHKESGYLLESYPDFSQVRMVRVLPDRVFVDFIKRNPVAIVKLYKNFALDDDGVLFYSLADVQENTLPVIVGLETKIFGPRPGQQYNVKELNAALEIIQYSRNNQSLKEYRIDTINVTESSQTSFVLLRATEIFEDEARIQVKIGTDSIRRRIAILGGLLRESGQDFTQIKYIDLRFKDAVIKFKEDSPGVS